LFAEARTDVLRLAALIAEKVVKRVIQLDPRVVEAQMEAVLGMIARRSELVVSINPADREAATAAMPALCAGNQSVRAIELIDDPTLARGSCIARSRGVEGGDGGGGQIDASIDAQLNRIIAALLPDEPGPRESPESRAPAEPPQ
jgi:flagellar biosynthesis/type III secretory pathway protein FliH